MDAGVTRPVIAAEDDHGRGVFDDAANELLLAFIATDYISGRTPRSQA
jgi:hypothetical protein